MRCAPTAKPDERLADQHPIAYRSAASQTEAMIALVSEGPAVHPMGDYWQAIAYRRLACVAAPFEPTLRWRERHEGILKP